MVESVKAIYRRVMPKTLRRRVLELRHARWRRLGEVEQIYTSEFFLGNQQRQLQDSAHFADAILNHFSPESVVDIGCGAGGYLSAFQQRGLKILGIDGSTAVLDYLLIEKQFFKIADLRNPIDFEQKFDLALCIEVAEHLDKEFARNLVGTVVSASETVIFSAATPGQGGWDHVNEQPHSYWIELFKQHRFEANFELTLELRQELKGLHASWLEANLILFQNRA